MKDEERRRIRSLRFKIVWSLEVRIRMMRFFSIDNFGIKTVNIS
jgi:hypothetical protein